MLQHLGNIFFKVSEIDRKQNHTVPTIYLDIYNKNTKQIMGQIRFNHDPNYSKVDKEIRMAFDVFDQNDIDPLRTSLLEDIIVGGFVWITMDNHYTYNSVGCPSGTVTAKYKGAGMLRDLDTLRAFLDEVFTHASLPVSIKTRIGFADPEEWAQILAIYRQYPIYELTVHPRTRVQYYKGKIWDDAFVQAQAALTIPLIYNGDVFSPQDAANVLKTHPDVTLMLGRGLLTNPALARQLHGGQCLSVNEVRQFHDALYEEYLAQYPKNIAVWRMCDAMKYLSLAFEEPHKCVKAMRKARSEAEYLNAVRCLFSEHPLRDSPYFSPAL